MRVQFKCGVICSRQLLRNVLVEDFLHGQGDDDFVAALEERFDLLQRVGRIIERLFLLPFYISANENAK